MDFKKAKSISSRIIKLGFMSYSAIRGAESVSNFIKTLGTLINRKGK